ncbi:hypothetical protein [Maricaulis parjimensis]|uniref:hypothetical protein n=1 Tax=Maricaulis parjimensis TaxID=144023 RepID=UPI00193AA757|nr:hypothetical protein [Maricaulis parjimensis]
MSPTMRWILLLLSLVLTALIALAVGTGDFSAAGAWLVTDPWGRVTLFDLYLGFGLSALVIAAFERRIGPSLFWIAPIFVLGNVWTAIWFIWRLPKLWSRLSNS